MKKKNILIYLLCVILLTACKSTVKPANNTSDTEASSNNSDSSIDNLNKQKSNDDKDDNSEEYTIKTNSGTYTNKFSNADTKTSEEDAIIIKLKEKSIDCDSSNVSIVQNKATIKAKGTYVISGTLNDGQIIVDTDEDSKVRLVLDNANITSSTTAPIYIVSCDKTIITLKDNTTNTLSDKKLTTTDAIPNACIYSIQDLTINGNGKLKITANANNGISTKDDLTIISGNIEINAVKNAIKGNDSIAIKDGTFSIISGKDALKSSQSEKAGQGYIYIQNGFFSIKAQSNGLQAFSAIKIENAKLKISSIKEAVYCDGVKEITDGCIQ